MERHRRVVGRRRAQEEIVQVLLAFVVEDRHDGPELRILFAHALQ